jgi:hypothetical protein
MNLRKTHRWLVAALLAGALAPTVASARVFTVGGDIACDFHSVQAALDAAAASPGRDTIRIARNLRHEGGVLVARGDEVRLVGGFADCRREYPLGVTRLGRDGEPVRLVSDGVQRVAVAALFTGDALLAVESTAVAASAVELAP